MNKIRVLAASVAVVAFISPALAQNAAAIPPENAKSLSSIITEIEKRPDFRYISSLEWDDDGYYEVTYHTSDKAKVEIKIDAVSGSPRD